MDHPALSIAKLLQGADASDAGVARVFERVRDIPFTFATHNDADTLLACGAGTCAPKHALLARLYGQLGLETRFIYVAFRFDDMPGDWPREPRHAVHDGIVRGHAALRVRRPSGWVDVDATFDQPLTEARFIVTERPEHEERLLGLSHRTSLSGSVFRELNAWLEMVRTDVRARRGNLHSRWA